MVRTLKLLQCLLLSAVILNAGAKRADAFFLLPPMPWDIEIDIPGNANKVISNLKAYYRQLQTVQSELNSQKLEVLKKGQAFNEFKKFIKIDEKKKNKAPGKGGLANNSDLGITEGGLNEEENFNAFHKLFFVYPPKSAYSGHYPIVKTAYNLKAKEYVQDVVMETYLVGRVTEDYLALVEKTLERLDNCQKGLYTKDEMADKCVFFGLQMAYIDPQKAEPEGDPENSENAGQYGEAMNAYIVTTVYDRLLRIVEDLTGAESQFLSALQIKLVDPIEPDETSSAEDYTDTSFRFAYNDSHDYAHAVNLIANYARSKACENGGTDCAVLNEDRAKIENVDETDILGKLQPVDEALNQAMVLHNLKAQLPEYKAQYRKYLKAQEIHDRMMDVLKKSDECAVNFLNKNGAPGTSVWYGGSAPEQINDYESRAGLSRVLIAEYQKDTTDTLIGTASNECDGFYESCPEGYRLDANSACETDSSKMACIVDTVAADTDTDYTPKLAEDYATEGAKNTRAYNDTDYLIDGTKADVIQTENRVKAEKSWRIGYNAVMEMTENGTLKFKPWNDQKKLQSEYLRNKYRNMRMIVKAVDQGMMSYRVAKTQAEGYSRVGPVEQVMPTVTACMLTTDATEAAYNKLGCSGGCSVSGDQATCSGSKGVECDIPATCTGTGTDSEGNSYTYTYSCIKHITETAACTMSGNNGVGFIDGAVVSPNCINQAYHYDQRTTQAISGGCAFPKPSTTYEKLADSATKSCPGKWDFTTRYLVQKYLPAVVGSYKWNGSSYTYENACPGSLDAQTVHLYDNTTKEMAGRQVAADKYENIFKVRKAAETELVALVKTYEADMKNLRDKLKSTIDSRKSHSERVSKATENATCDKNDKGCKEPVDSKNEAIQERERSLRRITAIEAELNDLENNRIPALKDRLGSRSPKPESLEKDLESLTTGAGKDLDKFEKPTLAQKIGIIPALKAEMAFIKTGAGTNPYENIEDETKIFTDIPTLEKVIASSQTIIDSAQSILDVLQAQIDSLEKQIRARAETFAKKYLERADFWQAEIEKASKELEDKLETKDDGSEPDRMVNENRQRCTKHNFWGTCTRRSAEFKFDNLKWTMARVMFGEGNSNDDNAVRGELRTIVNDTMDERWFKGEKWAYYPQKLANNGVVSKFVVANGCLSAYGVADGVHTPATIAEALKKQSMAEAVSALAANPGGIIPQADTDIKNEIDSAIGEITKVMEEWGVTGEDGVSPNDAIFIHENYAKDGTSGGEQLVTARHYKLLEELKQAEKPAILASADIKLEESFGMPVDSEIVTDDDYFVGLPARGKYTVTVPTYGRQPAEFQFDANDGRDYMAPHRPLLNLAPLREVFYYSAMDYDDTPKTDNAPSRTYLIDVKYKGISGGIYSTETYRGRELTKEYMPEVWRYLLATPNFREDGKYQQTFVERAFDIKEMKKELSGENGELDKHYRTIVSRAGVYPCNAGGTTLDMGSGDSAESMSFKRNNSVAAGGTCQEAKMYKGGVQQLLADHDSQNDKNSKALQKSLGSTSEPLYGDHSELGQFLEGELKYRPLIQSINEYLLDNSHQENSIERQRAEVATFRRNVLGSFLEAVNAEHAAKKTLDNNKEDVMKSLENLCAQIHKYGESVNGEACEDENDSECAAAINASCAEFIESSGGLAATSADNKYEPACPGAGGSYYDHIFCQLDSWKDEKLAEAEEKFALVQQEKFPEKVEERITEIKNYFEAFKADADEVSYMQPKSDGAQTVAAVKEALANREASRAAEDEGITSMDNQSRAVAYCPVY